MLDKNSVDLIKSSIPAIVSLGPKLTEDFYKRMLKNHPELKNIFNQAHQGSGAQREALFNAVCAYASNLDNLEVLGGAVEKIANKHAALLVKPEQYNIVGENLLKSIEELLNPGQEIINAWAKAYGVLAKIFIEREEQIYKENEQKEGGWRGIREFRVIKKEKQSDIITSFDLEPVDGKKVATFKPGQYLGIVFNDDCFDNGQMRQYSISRAFDGKSYRIAIKRENQGLVSNYMHDCVNEGDIVKLTPPVGDFFLDCNKVKNVCLMSAGVGITPMLCMLGTLVDNNFKGKVTWLHGAHSENTIAFTHEVSDMVQKLESFNAMAFLSNIGERSAQCPYVKQGRMNLDTIKDMIDIKDTDYYMCGPLSFMQDMAKKLIAMGVEQDKIHYEVFGPHKVL